MDLSIFVDESGDFDINSKHSPYYIFTLIIHNQKIALSKSEKALFTTKEIKKMIKVMNEKRI